MPRAYPRHFVGTDVDGLLLRAEQLFVRKENLNDLLGKATFTDALFNLLRGRLPTPKERDLFDLVLVAFHGGFGLLPPTTLVPRLVAGTGVSVPQALAAGYLASGPYHVGAVEEAMALYQQVYDAYRSEVSEADRKADDLETYADRWIVGMVERGETVAGYGHPLFRNDPRPLRIRRVLCDQGVDSPYLDVYDGVVRSMSRVKQVPPNIDGMAAAILLTLGLQPEHGTGLFLLARTAAMLAHVVEERQELPYQTQKRFMILPVLAPYLFNLNFKWWAKFFNRLRDHPGYQRLLALFGGNARKPFLASEAEDRAVVEDAKRRRTGRPLAKGADDAPDSTGQGRQPRDVVREAVSASEGPPFVPQELLGDDDLREAAQLVPEPLVGAAVCLASSLHRLRSEEGPPRCGPSAERVEELLGAALKAVHEAAALANDREGAEEQQAAAADGGAGGCGEAPSG